MNLYISSGIIYLAIGFWIMISFVGGWKLEKPWTFDQFWKEFTRRKGFPPAYIALAILWLPVIIIGLVFPLFEKAFFWLDDVNKAISVWLYDWIEKIKRG